MELPAAAEKTAQNDTWGSASSEPAAESRSCMLCFLQQQSMITQIEIYCSIDFTLHPYTGNLLEVSTIYVLIDRCSCAA